MKVTLRNKKLKVQSPIDVSTRPPGRTPGHSPVPTGVEIRDNHVRVLADSAE